MVRSGDPVEQEKHLKYASLVANAVMLSNVVDLSEVLSVMAKEGQPVTAALAARISPYIRDHIRRFGRFALDMTQLPKTPRSA
ncbi:Tn3 family transposase, partial [Acidiphilium sp.]|uniref:Tn3 family transposase n=1 Tax=Acidiphilium sp. TaxID=527 RepID=UPI00258A93BB